MTGSQPHDRPPTPSKIDTLSSLQCYIVWYKNDVSLVLTMHLTLLLNSLLKISNTPVVIIKPFVDFDCDISDTSVQSWATTTPKLRAQYPTPVDQVRSGFHLRKSIDYAHRYLQLYNPSLAA